MEGVVSYFNVVLLSAQGTKIFYNSMSTLRNLIHGKRIQSPELILKLLCIIKKLHGLSPRANYTDQANAACRRSDCQLFRIEGATWSA
jgi:hypothetical protein